MHNFNIYCLTYIFIICIIKIINIFIQEVEYEKIN